MVSDRTIINNQQVHELSPVLQCRPPTRASTLLHTIHTARAPRAEDQASSITGRPDSFCSPNPYHTRANQPGYITIELESSADDSGDETPQTTAEMTSSGSATPHGDDHSVTSERDNDALSDSHQDQHHEHDQRHLNEHDQHHEHEHEHDDDWSRKVETDETTAHSGIDFPTRAETVTSTPMGAASMTAIAGDHDVGDALMGQPAIASLGLAPKRDEPTLKEILVERERQKRLESERARLKRQFALASSGRGAADDDASLGLHDATLIREHGSVQGTVGDESTIAHAELDDNDERKLTYPMERFLQEQESQVAGAPQTPPSDAPSVTQSISRADQALAMSATPESEAAQDLVCRDAVSTATPEASSIHRSQEDASLDARPVTSDDDDNAANANARTDNGVLMERFLTQPVELGSLEDRPADVASQRTVSFDMGQETPDRSRAVASGRTTPADEPRDELLHASTDVMTSMSSLPPIGQIIPSVDLPSGTAPATTEGALSETAAAAAGAGRGDAGGAGLNAGASLQQRQRHETPPLTPDHLVPEIITNRHDGSPTQDSPSLGVSSIASDQPRLLRLTEAEIQEMAAIEEVSTGNAPPSERGDISESSFVGELMGDFGPNVDPAGTLSQGTTATAVESISVRSGNPSAMHSIEHSHDHDHDHQSLDGMGGAPSISDHSNILASSVTANPPSVIEPDNQGPAFAPDDINPSTSDSLADNISDGNVSNTPPGRASVPDSGSPELQAQLGAQPSSDEPIHATAPSSESNAVIRQLASVDEIEPDIAEVVNRRIRPGMVSLLPGQRRSARDLNADVLESPVRRVASVPVNMDINVDGFDYDKFAPLSPNSKFSDSLRDLPPDVWSPAGKMAISPLQMARKPIVVPETAQAMPMSMSMPRPLPTPDEIEIRESPVYGSTEDIDRMLRDSKPPAVKRSSEALEHGQPISEETPLLSASGIPREIVANSWDSKQKDEDKQAQQQGPSPSNLPTSASPSETDSPIQRTCFSATKFTVATVAVELIVVWILTSWSSSLCTTLGLRRLFTLMILLPLQLAQTSSVGLQQMHATDSQLRRAPGSLMSYEDKQEWARQKLIDACRTGAAVSILLAAIVLSMSDFDVLFALSVATGGVLSTVASGFVGVVVAFHLTKLDDNDMEIARAGMMAVHNVVCVAVMILSVIVFFNVFDDAQDLGAASMEIECQNLLGN